MKVRFWGVRGSYPVPGPSTNRYGGNTSCVTVQAEGGPLFIIDAGTGIRQLGKELLKGEFGEGKGVAHLLISHTHWDHIQGLPFFGPLYHAGNLVQVYARQRNDTHLRAVFASQASAPYFPVPFEKVAANVAFTELLEGSSFSVGQVRVSCTKLNHPWIAIAYRLDDGKNVVCYVTDTAPFRDILIEQQFISGPPEPGGVLKPEDAAKLAMMRQGVVRLCEGADLVIYDTQFTPEEYRTRAHWGHSCPEDAIEIARDAGAKAVAFFHHAPDRTDDELDELLRFHRANTKDLSLLAATEGLEIQLGIDSEFGSARVEAAR